VCVDRRSYFNNDFVISHEMLEELSGLTDINLCNHIKERLACEHGDIPEGVNA
jgi:hypothetical protein